MPFSFTMPKLSPTMEVGVIVKWHKQEGDFVEPNALLLEVATDKATVEHYALDEGWLRKILVPEGEEAEVNQPIAIFTVEKEESLEGWSPVPFKQEKPTEASTLEGEEKVVPSPKERSTKSSFQMAAFIPEEPLHDYTFQYPRESLNTRIKASPLARRLAKEQGLDLTTVQGSGPGGRIVSEDLVRAQKEGAAVFGRRDVPQIPPGTYEEEKLTPMRQVVAQRLQEAKTFIPHFYVSQGIQADALVEMREQLSRMEVKVSINDCVLRAVALSLRLHPGVNSGFNTVNQTIIRFKTIDISMAVSLEGGLITPILRHVDYKNLGEISLETRYLAKRAREGKLSLEEFKGGSFTVSNLGMYGITDFQAIINPPQAAILAVSGVQNVPVVKGGSIVPGKVMHVTLSCDHRVIDGVAAAEFLKTLQKYLENPSILLV